MEVFEEFQSKKSYLFSRKQIFILANQLSCGTNGSEVSVCRDSLVSNKTVFGFTSSMTLNLYDAHLTMDFIGGTYNSSKTFSASISFLCDRKADVGQPGRIISQTNKF